MPHYDIVTYATYVVFGFSSSVSVGIILALYVILSETFRPSVLLSPQPEFQMTKWQLAAVVFILCSVPFVNIYYISTALFGKEEQ